MKLSFMKSVLLFFAVVVTIMGIFFIKNKIRVSDYSKKLTIAVQENDIYRIKAIIQEEPHCVNLLPTITPRFIQIILELPVVCYPLQTACSWGNYDVIKIFLENGADCNLVWKGREGSQSPLIRTVLSGVDESEQIIQLLLQYGADKDYVDESGKTAYDYAVESDNAVLQELLK